MDVYIAGFATTFSSIRWGIMLLAMHTDIQAKMRAEINSIGSSNMPA
jgi:cytochrome P450